MIKFLQQYKSQQIVTYKTGDKTMQNSVTTTSGKTKIKIVLLGNQMVGKSSIIQKYVKGYFDESTHPTVGIDFLVKNVTYRNKNYRLQLWDTAGQQRFRSLIPNYLKDAKCALIVIDVSRQQSLQSVDSWYQLYNDNKNGDGFVFLLGNKIDLQERQIIKEKAMKKAQELGIMYEQLSAKSGQNIDNVFHKIIQKFIQITSGGANNMDSSVKKQQKGVSGQIKQNAIQQQQDQKQKRKHRKSIGQGNNVVLKNEKIINYEKGNEGKKGKNNNKKKHGCC